MMMNLCSGVGLTPEESLWESRAADELVILA